MSSVIKLEAMLLSSTLVLVLTVFESECGTNKVLAVVSSSEELLLEEFNNGEDLRLAVRLG